MHTTKLMNLLRIWSFSILEKKSESTSLYKTFHAHSYLGSGGRNPANHYNHPIYRNCWIGKLVWFRIFAYLYTLPFYLNSVVRGKVEQNSRWCHQNLPETLNSSFLRLGGNVPKVMWGQRARRLKRIRGRWRLCSWTLKSSQGSNTQAGYTTFLLFSLNYLNYLAYISKTSLLLVYCMILGAGQGRVWVIKQFTDSLFLISFILVSLCQ